MTVQDVDNRHHELYTHTEWEVLDVSDRGEEEDRRLRQLVVAGPKVNKCS